MAVVNVTPDSFSDGGVRFDADRAIADGERMVADGADILDIGGESTRPGAEPLPEDEELRRVLPVIDGLRAPRVRADLNRHLQGRGRRARDGFGRDDRQRHLRVHVRPGARRRRRAPARGGRCSCTTAGDRPPCTRARPTRKWWAKYRLSSRTRANAAIAAGIRRERIILDPGLGFAKHASQSLEALAGFRRFAALGYPLLSGPSRKSFLKVALGDVPPGERMWGTAAAVAASVLLGAHIVRVHDVREMVQVVRVTDSILSHAS